VSDTTVKVEPTRILRCVTASPSASSAEVGTITLLEETTFHSASQYPGADTWVKAQPQTVPLLSNGYYVTARFTGIVTARGYYGGLLDVEESYYWSRYAYQVDAYITGEFPEYARPEAERYRFDLTI
jgi:hypothetical protein